MSQRLFRVDYVERSYYDSCIMNAINYRMKEDLEEYCRMMGVSLQELRRLYPISRIQESLRGESDVDDGSVGRLVCFVLGDNE